MRRKVDFSKTRIGKTVRCEYHHRPLYLKSSHRTGYLTQTAAPQNSDIAIAASFCILAAAVGATFSVIRLHRPDYTVFTVLGLLFAICLCCVACFGPSPRYERHTMEGKIEARLRECMGDEAPRWPGKKSESV